MVDQQVKVKVREIQDFTRSTSVQREKHKILVATASNDHMQQPPQSNCHRLSRWNIFAALSPECKQVFLVSVVNSWCSIQESCESNVPRQSCNIRSETSIPPRRMWQTKVSIQRDQYNSSLRPYRGKKAWGKKNPAWSDSTCTLLFDPCKSSCQGNAQLVSAGGPTTMRSNRSSLWMARCDAPKQATGEITFSK